jgi:hypothetical protein
MCIVLLSLVNPPTPILKPQTRLSYLVNEDERIGHIIIPQVHHGAANPLAWQK